MNLGALGAADPVGLHEADALGPVDGAEVEQFVGVAGDAEEPLFEVALDDGRLAAFAAAGLALGAEDLLVGEDGLAGGAPVGGRHLAIGQVVLIEEQEPPLGPAVVLRIGSDDFAGPVEGGAHAAELGAHALDVAIGPGVGVDVLPDGGVFGGEAEGVEADGEEDVLAAHAVIAGGDIRGGEGVPVDDVEVAAGVGEHGEGVPARAGVVVGGAVEAVGLPAGLPFGLDALGVVGGQGVGGHGTPWDCERSVPCDYPEGGLGASIKEVCLAAFGGERGNRRARAAH